MKKNSSPQCPKCKSENVIPIVYGYPGDEAFKLSKEEKVKLGGCIIKKNNPNLYCNACGNKWLDKDYSR